MDYLLQHTRAEVMSQLQQLGFSIGEAESRVEGLDNEQDLVFLARYINERDEVSVDEIRMVHTRLVKAREMKMIGTKKGRSALADREAMSRDLLLRYAEIDWRKPGLEFYLKGIPALRGLNRIDFRKPITFFVGENGSGKSTLLEGLAVAAGFNPEGGTRNYNFATKDTHSELHRAIHLARGARRRSWGIFLRAETFYNMATEADRIDKEGGDMFKRYGGESFHCQSHGESFYTMLETDIQENGLYFFDEPEAALSPRRQLNLLGLLYEYASRGAQFIIATHSPILLACPDATIYEFSKYGVNEVGYEDTDIYRIVSGFVNDREQMLKEVIFDGRQF